MKLAHSFLAATGRLKGVLKTLKMVMQKADHQREHARA